MDAQGRILLRNSIVGVDLSGDVSPRNDRLLRPLRNRPRQLKEHLPSELLQIVSFERAKIRDDQTEDQTARDYTLVSNSQNTKFD